MAKGNVEGKGHALEEGSCGRVDLAEEVHALFVADTKSVLIRIKLYEYLSKVVRRKI